LEPRRVYATIASGYSDLICATYSGSNCATKASIITQFSKYPHPKAKAKPGSRFRDFFKNISRVALSASLTCLFGRQGFAENSAQLCGKLCELLREKKVLKDSVCLQDTPVLLCYSDLICATFPGSNCVTSRNQSGSITTTIL